MESFGERLRREREKRGITLEEIASSTKIGTRMLHALEEEHFDQLPGGIFNKGFIRAYARHLGVDEDQAVADYLAAAKVGQPGKKPDTLDPAEPLEMQAEADNSAPVRIPWGLLAVALLIIALAFAAWSFYKRNKSGGRAVHDPIAASLPAAIPAGQTNAASAAPAAPVHAGSPQLAPQEIRSATAGLPSQASMSSPISSPVSSPALPQVSRPASPSVSPSATSPAEGHFVVVIRAREDAWVSITADGKTILTDTLIAMTDSSVEARNTINIKTGNVGGLDFWFNGKKLPPQGDYNQIKTLNFDAKGLQPSPAKP